MRKRAAVESTQQPSLFQSGRLEEQAELASKPAPERPYQAPLLLLGTSAFTATGWQGNFYHVSTAHGAGTSVKQPPEHLAHYALNATASAVILLAQETGEY